LMGGVAKGLDDLNHVIHKENIKSLYAYSSGWHIQAYRDMLKISAGTTFLETALVPADKYTIADMFQRIGGDMKPRDGDNLQKNETWLNIKIDGSNDNIVKIVKRDRMDDFLVDLVKVAVPNNSSMFKEALKNTSFPSHRASEINEVIESLGREEAQSGSKRNPTGKNPPGQFPENHGNFVNPAPLDQPVTSPKPETPGKTQAVRKKNDLTRWVLLISGICACCLALVVWLRSKRSCNP